jgi:hypothetical protein
MMDTAYPRMKATAMNANLARMERPATDTDQRPAIDLDTVLVPVTAMDTVRRRVWIMDTALVPVTATDTVRRRVSTMDTDRHPVTAMDTGQRLVSTMATGRHPVTAMDMVRRLVSTMDMGPDPPAVTDPDQISRVTDAPPEPRRLRQRAMPPSRRAERVCPRPLPGNDDRAATRRR